MRRAAAVVAAAGLVGLSACDTTVDPPPPDVTDAGQGGWDGQVVDPVPRDVMVADPLPPDVHMADPPPPDVMVADPLPPDVVVVDPLPPDAFVADPPPPDVVVVDPLPPDTFVADPPPPDVMVMDPLPPDVTGGDAERVDQLPPPVDPPPPDMSGADPLPESASALPLDRSFRVRLEMVERRGDTLRLRAVVSGAESARVRWSGAGGTLRADGAEAEFTLGEDGEPLVVVTAEAGATRLDVARLMPAREG